MLRLPVIVGSFLLVWCSSAFVAEVPPVGRGGPGQTGKVLFRVKLGGHWGYISRQGKMVIKPRFDWAGPFSEGLAPFAIGGETITFFGMPLQAKAKYGYVDLSGKIVIRARFDFATVFLGDAPALVGIGGKAAYIRRTGKPAFPTRFQYAFPFNEGLAAVGMGELAEQQWGFIDRHGEWVIRPRFERAFPFSEGLAVVAARIRRGRRHGIIDKNGKYAVSPRFSDALGFTEGLTAVEADGKWGFVNRTGQFVIAPQFEYVTSFGAGLAAAKKGGKFGFIDRTGKWIVAPRFDVVTTTPQRGPIPVNIGGKSSGDLLQEPWLSHGGKWGYVDRTGEWIVRPQFDMALETRDGLGMVGMRTGPAGDDDAAKWRYGYIDESGKYVWKPTK